MSTLLLGFALGLNAAAAADAPTMNPAVLAADRQYQQLIYEHRPVAVAGIGQRLAASRDARNRQQTSFQNTDLAAQ